MLIKTAGLTPYQRSIILDKGTDRPYTTDCSKPATQGTYLCRQCGLALFRSHHQFTSSCGWPSFDDELPDAIKRQKDQDGSRTEIVCYRCDGHLGHVFKGEQLTDNNLRHCVNGTSVEFVEAPMVIDTEEMIVAGGCFWGIAHLLSQEQGVLISEAGYCGGTTRSPSYSQVCSGQTGHLEAVRVVYDGQQTDYRTLLKVFFEIHDPFQSNGQGLDIGSQYLSAVFYYDDYQQHIAQDLIETLKQAYKTLIATKLLPVSSFWPAETEHQGYFYKHPHAPHCHRRTTRF